MVISRYKEEAVVINDDEKIKNLNWIDRVNQLGNTSPQLKFVETEIFPLATLGKLVYSWKFIEKPEMPLKAIRYETCVLKNI